MRTLNKTYGEYVKELFGAIKKQEIDAATLIWTRKVNYHELTEASNEPPRYPPL